MHRGKKKPKKKNKKLPMKEKQKHRPEAVPASRWSAPKASKMDVPTGDADTGEVVRLLRGARLITDWESRYPSEEAVAQLGKRRQSRVAARLVELSKTYGLASREMSLVAVVKRMGDRPGELPVTRVVPVGVPEDTSFLALCRGPKKTLNIASYVRTLFSREAQSLSSLDEFAGASIQPSSSGPLYSRRRTSDTTEATGSNSDLVDLAAMLEPDGGMPGDSPSVRTGRTIAAVLAFVAAGHTLTAGAFRLHVTRLVGFLKSVSVASDLEGRLIERALDAASTGNAPAGTWLQLARDPSIRWKQIEVAWK